MISLVIYTFICYLLSLIFILSPNDLLNAFAQATPLIAVILLIVFGSNRFNTLKTLGLFSVGKIRYYLIAILLPLLSIVIGFSVSALLGFTNFHPLLGLNTFLQHYLLLIFMWPLLWAFTEEIGWRGFLQPKLIGMYGVEKGIFYTGLIWAFWHYIFIFAGGYYEIGNVFLNACLFTITVVLMSFTLGWIRLASKSIWPCVVFHAASNAALQMCSPQWKIINSHYIYVAGEAGIANMLFWAIVFVLIRNRLLKSSVIKS
ncbi:MAG: CPBP family intramembrane metalloprotease [Gammaproteobacteria bacterium]|nr:CPBP family intramembrane metalloprotease [Gammaproteobacteria bacterium]